MSFKAFKSFAEKAATRCGVTFELKSVQKNFDGIITAVKGSVFIPGESGNLAANEMLWNLKGQAMLFGEQFDLIHEVGVSEVEDDAPIAPESKA